MGTFDIHPDAPNTLRAESLNINIKFDKLPDGTGRVSWNIPIPAAGCAAEDQAYCGMLVMISNTPFSPTTNAPQHGTVYSSDPTASQSLHSGDSVGDAYVIGAFYNDTITTSFLVSDVASDVPYYVYGFPMDCQFRYFREGVHAQSVDGTTSNQTPDTPGTQIVALNTTTTPSGVGNSDLTSLEPTTDYTFTMSLGVEPKPNRPVGEYECRPTPPQHTIVINGARAQTYGELVDEINLQIKQLESPIISTTPPFTGNLVITGNPKKLYEWTGYDHVERPMISQTTAPTELTPGDYWYNPEAAILRTWNGASWDIVTYVAHGTDPTTPTCDVGLWYNGSSYFRWNGTTWCDVTTVVGSSDPSVPVVECGSYWHNTSTYYLYKWNENTYSWESVDAIQSTVDPTILADGHHWFDESDSSLKMLDGGAWVAQPLVRYTEQEPLDVVPGTKWYNPTDNVLQIRNISDDGWDASVVIAYPTDPTNIASCDLWWFDDGSGLVLYVWNAAGLEWVEVTKLYIGDTDPSAPPVIQQGTVWVNSDTGVASEWDNGCFKLVDAINHPSDPTELVDGTIWYDESANAFNIMQGGEWVSISPTVADVDPVAVPIDTMWYNTGTTGLSRWNGVSWIAVSYSPTLVSPQIGQPWLNPITSDLLEWNGVSYVPATPRATVEIDCSGNLKFTHTLLGSLSFMKLTDGTLFSSLNVPYAFDDPVPGTDGVSSQPSYEEEGIGTDGSADERLLLSNEIRMAFGYPTIDVELTQEQIDLSIKRALSEYRERAGGAYKHAFFFMRTIGNQQRYFLTNKIQGMNKIVTVTNVQRLTSSFLSSAHGAGVYGQIILQQLYNMGNFDILSYHLQAEYVKTLEIMFAGRVTFTWNEHTRELFIHNKFPFPERVILIEATVERTEQDIMNDRWCKEWIRRWAQAECMEMLAHIRGKYSTLPGAGGSVSLNAADLRASATEEKRALLQEIDDFVVDRPEDAGYRSAFVFG